jgi:hypothetical protein
MPRSMRYRRSSESALSSPGHLGRIGLFGRGNREQPAVTLELEELLGHVPLARSRQQRIEVTGVPGPQLEVNAQSGPFPSNAT